ncbi:uncharacterized protein LOC107643642 isoform X1 [Arachis ipaensis]|uniref:uncharacterized protein LOC107643642 isoform X1 n=2 Tax=Arachis ipaensis TaxID=130454 RepID=UPI000A2B7825|nr:uncharacterized protein LOC107643642 isoform X1 [Arachis ipaensis]XP_020979538.1 uncharacterized protein LOC107643642 isoform X1 [Arachis ipaensis]
MLDGFLKIPIAIHPQLHQLVCTEDRFFHRKQNGVKSYCSLVLRQYLILLKQSEEEFQSVFHSFEFRLRVSLAAEGYLSASFMFHLIPKRRLLNSRALTTRMCMS